MLANNLISATIGFIPIAGDIMLAVFKANSRNAALLEVFLRERAAEIQKELEQAQQVAQHLTDVQGTQTRPGAPKKEGSWWARRQSKGVSKKGLKTTIARGEPPVHRPSASGDSRFVEAVSS